MINNHAIFWNEGRLVGVFDFSILEFEQGNCPSAWGFSKGSQNFMNQAKFCSTFPILLVLKSLAVLWIKCLVWLIELEA